MRKNIYNFRAKNDMKDKNINNLLSSIFFDFVMLAFQLKNIKIQKAIYFSHFKLSFKRIKLTIIEKSKWEINSHFSIFISFSHKVKTKTIAIRIAVTIITSPMAS